MMNFSDSTVLQQVRILDPLRSYDQVGDLWIHYGKIQALGSVPTDLPADSQTIDGQGWVVGPGLVDLYAHSGEPGFEQRETLESLAQAALAGGFSQVALLPTTDPVLESPELLSQLPGRWIRLAAVTQGAKGLHMTNLAEWVRAGVTAFCDDHPIGSVGLLQKILEYLQPFGIPLLLWPWERALAQGGAVYEGEWALRLGLKGIPPLAETLSVSTLLELVRRTPTPVHLMRISQARSLELIRQAQAEGLPITASITWLHLLLCDQDIAHHQYNPNLRLDPPLGSAANRQALVQALSDGSLSIATDHSPYAFEEKTVPFGEAPPGAIGLELALPLLWTELVGSGQVSALTLWSALSLNPARCLQLPLPSLEIGCVANLAILDPNQDWEVNATTIRSQSAATHWWHQRIRGKVIACL